MARKKTRHGQKRLARRAAIVKVTARHASLKHELQQSFSNFEDTIILNVQSPLKVYPVDISFKNKSMSMR